LFAGAGGGKSFSGLANIRRRRHIHFKLTTEFYG
jgi:hypothetical protein